MYDEIFNRTNASFERFLEPTRRFQALLVDNAERMASFQFDAAKSYADLGLKNLREGLAVSDVKGFQSYVSNQGDMVRAVAEKMQDDTRTVVGLQQDFGKECQKLFQENASGALNEARSAGKKAADAAAESTGRKSA